MQKVVTNDCELYEGDCLEIMKLIPDKSIDMILCDPPYGTTSKNEWDTKLPLATLWKEYKRIIKGNGAILLFGQPPFSSELIMSNRKMFRYEWIWEKPLAQGFLNANRMPMRATENICVFYSKLPTYNPQKKDGKPYNKTCGANQTTNYGDFGENKCVNETGKRFPTNVLHFSNANHSQIFHPTQKPVELLEYLIRTYTNEGDTVLDNCMGSGSTGIACANLNRDFIGIEIREDYYKIACERIRNNQKQISIDMI